MSVSFEINTPSGPAVQSPNGHILLADLFEADTEIGGLIWKARPVELFASLNAFGTWNTRWAGTAALAANHSKGYKFGDVFGRKTLAHRVIFAIQNGKWPVAHIDHVNGIKSDNRACNLRAVTNAENLKNAAIRADNTSGVVGISWDKRHQKWHARIKSAGKRINLGLFSDIETATLARKIAEAKYGYHPNHGRKAMGAESARREN